MNRNEAIEIFTALGRKLSSGLPSETIAAAQEANPWFSAADIDYALRAICSEMLDREKLSAWLRSCEEVPVATPRNIAIIMAGNIPLVGFYDLLCTVCAGHKAYIKPSSKDYVLMNFVADCIGSRYVCRLTDGFRPDAALLTGGDDAIRHFTTLWRDVPLLVRSHRSSAAILDGTESNDELVLLADDIFRYNSLGCRNVSMLLVPDNYDFGRLTAVLSAYGGFTKRYRDNYRQRRALLAMQGVAALDCGTFLLCRDDAFPESLAQINYTYYSSPVERDAWLARHDAELQCVVSRSNDHQRHANFGEAQRPALTDYPDGKDVMAFLLGLAISS